MRFSLRRRPGKGSNKPTLIRKNWERLKNRARYFWAAPLSRTPNLREAKQSLRIVIDRMMMLNAEIMTIVYDPDMPIEKIKKISRLKNNIRERANVRITKLAIEDAVRMLRLTPDQQTRVRTIMKHAGKVYAIPHVETQLMTSRQMTRELIEVIGKNKTIQLIKIMSLHRNELSTWFAEELKAMEKGFLVIAQSGVLGQIPSKEPPTN